MTAPAMLKFVFVAVLLYLGVVAAHYAFQRKLQYFPFPQRASPSQYGLSQVEEVAFDTEDGERLRAWYAKAQGDRATILYFHGNAEALQHRWKRVKLFTENGYGILIVSYRGYAGSTGAPSEKGLHYDAAAALRFLQIKGLEARDLIYFGESLGTGVAVPLAAREPPAALVLDSPFTSAADVGQHTYWYLPTRFLMKDKFDNMAFADKIISPTFVFHSNADQIVPLEFGRRLFEAIKAPKEFLRLPGSGHVEPLTAQSWGAINAFLEKYTGRS